MKAKPLPVTFLNQMAEVLKVMGFGYRLRIVEFLDLHGPNAPARSATLFARNTLAARPGLRA